MNTFAFPFFFPFAGRLGAPVCTPLSPLIPSPEVWTPEAAAGVTDGGFPLGVLGVDGGEDGGDGPGDCAAGVVTNVGVIPYAAGLGGWSITEV